MASSAPPPPPPQDATQRTNRDALRFAAALASASASAQGGAKGAVASAPSRPLPVLQGAKLFVTGPKTGLVSAVLAQQGSNTVRNQSAHFSGVAGAEGPLVGERNKRALAPGADDDALASKRSRLDSVHALGAATTNGAERMPDSSVPAAAAAAAAAAALKDVLGESDDEDYDDRLDLSVMSVSSKPPPRGVMQDSAAARASPARTDAPAVRAQPLPAVNKPDNRHISNADASPAHEALAAPLHPRKRQNRRFRPRSPSEPAASPDPTNSNRAPRPRLRSPHRSAPHPPHSDASPRSLSSPASPAHQRTHSPSPEAWHARRGRSRERRHSGDSSIDVDRPKQSWKRGPARSRSPRPWRRNKRPRSSPSHSPHSPRPSRWDPARSARRSRSRSLKRFRSRSRSCSDGSLSRSPSRFRSMSRSYSSDRQRCRSPPRRSSPFSRSLTPASPSAKRGAPRGRGTIRGRGAVGLRSARDWSTSPGPDRRRGPSPKQRSSPIRRHSPSRYPSPHGARRFRSRSRSPQSRSPRSRSRSSEHRSLRDALASRDPSPPARQSDGWQFDAREEASTAVLPVRSALGSRRPETVAGTTSTAAAPGKGFLPETLALSLGKTASPNKSTAVSEATSHARKVFIGNLAAGTPEAELTLLFNKAMRAAGLTTAPGDAILSCFINPSKRFGFIELRSPQETSNAMCLDGLVCFGHALTLRRPKDYKHMEALKLGGTEPAADLNLQQIQLVLDLLSNRDAKASKLYVENLPPTISHADLKAALSATSRVASVSMLDTDSAAHAAIIELGSNVYVDAAIAQLNGTELAGHTLHVRRLLMLHEVDAALEALMGVHDAALAADGTSGGGAPDENGAANAQSPVLTSVRLYAALDPEDIDSEQDRLNVKHDIQHEVCKYGTLSEVRMPELQRSSSGGSEHSVWNGDVLLRYETALDAQRAATALNGRLFGQRALHAITEAPCGSLRQESRS